MVTVRDFSIERERLQRERARQQSQRESARQRIQQQREARRALETQRSQLETQRALRSVRSRNEALQRQEKVSGISQKVGQTKKEVKREQKEIRKAERQLAQTETKAKAFEELSRRISGGKSRRLGKQAEKIISDIVGKSAGIRREIVKGQAVRLEAKKYGFRSDVAGFSAWAANFERQRQRQLTPEQRTAEAKAAFEFQQARAGLELGAIKDLKSGKISREQFRIKAKGFDEATRQQLATGTTTRIDKGTIIKTTDEGAAVWDPTMRGIYGPTRPSYKSLASGLTPDRLETYKSEIKSGKTPEQAYKFASTYSTGTVNPVTAEDVTTVLSGPKSLKTIKNLALRYVPTGILTEAQYQAATSLRTLEQESIAYNAPRIIDKNLSKKERWSAAGWTALSFTEPIVTSTQLPRDLIRYRKLDIKKYAPDDVKPFMNKNVWNYRPRVQKPSFKKPSTWLDKARGRKPGTFKKGSYLAPTSEVQANLKGQTVGVDWVLDNKGKIMRTEVKARTFPSDDLFKQNEKYFKPGGLSITKYGLAGRTEMAKKLGHKSFMEIPSFGYSITPNVWKSRKLIETQYYSGKGVSWYFGGISGEKKVKMFGFGLGDLGNKPAIYAGYFKKARVGKVTGEPKKVSKVTGDKIKYYKYKKEQKAGEFVYGSPKPEVEGTNLDAAAIPLREKYAVYQKGRIVPFKEETYMPLEIAEWSAKEIKAVGGKSKAEELIKTSISSSRDNVGSTQLSSPAIFSGFGRKDKSKVTVSEIEPTYLKGKSSFSLSSKPSRSFKSSSYSFSKSSYSYSPTSYSPSSYSYSPSSSSPSSSTSSYTPSSSSYSISKSSPRSSKSSKSSYGSRKSPKSPPSIPPSKPRKEPFFRRKKKIPVLTQAFKVGIISKGAKKIIGTGLTRKGARALGAKRVLKGTEATFYVERTKGLAREGIGQDTFKKYRQLFRAPKSGSKLKDIGEEVFVQKKRRTGRFGGRLSFTGEKAEIKKAQRRKRK